MGEFAAWPDRADLSRKEFESLLTELDEYRQRGLLEVVEATRPLDGTVVDGRWAADLMNWRVRVTATGRSYELSVDAYHGRCTWRRI